MLSVVTMNLQGEALSIQAVVIGDRVHHGGGMHDDRLSMLRNYGTDLFRQIGMDEVMRAEIVLGPDQAAAGFGETVKFRGETPCRPFCLARLLDRAQRCVFPMKVKNDLPRTPPLKRKLMPRITNRPGVNGKCRINMLVEQRLIRIGAPIVGIENELMHG